MATKVILRDSSACAVAGSDGVGGVEAYAVYDDCWRPIYEALGVMDIQRATSVEYEPSSGEWVATHQASGQVIGRSPQRKEAVAQEIAWLEQHEVTS